MSPLIRNNNLDPSNPLYYAPPRLRGRSPETQIEQADDDAQGALVPSDTGKKSVRLLSSREEPRRQSRIFDEAVTRALQDTPRPRAAPVL